MKQLLNVYKPKGLTPLQTITLLRKKFPEYANETIGFAGRLDPLAHGVLLLMVGKETTKHREEYLNLPKKYEFEAVFGVSTDTYDALGLINNLTMKSKMPRGVQFNNDLQNLEKIFKEFIKSKLGKQIQAYPPYSSKTVNGKPLYRWAREDKLHEIKIPTHEIEIYDLRLVEIQTISAEKLKEEIFKQINSVTGDFRQEKIKNKWETFFINNKKQKTNNQFLTAKLHISCSSGTYIRSLISELGVYTELEATALEIRRTKVGKYSVKHSLQFT